MRLRLLISLSCLLFLMGQRAGAQLAPADDFFHGGAQLYISNNVPQAKEVVEQGLRLYPGDDKLKKLEALLNQQQQQQNQQNQQQQQSQQNKSDEQKKQDQQKSQDQQKQDQQKQDEQKKDQAEQKKEDQQKQQDQQKKSQAEKDKADQDKKEQGQPVKPEEMTPEEAKHLLDAQKGDEQLLKLKPPEKPRDNSRPVKDW